MMPYDDDRSRFFDTDGGAAQDDYLEEIRRQMEFATYKGRAVFVACPCGRKVDLVGSSYRCLQCGVVFCKSCAHRHFELHEAEASLDQRFERLLDRLDGMLGDVRAPLVERRGPYLTRGHEIADVLTQFLEAGLPHDELSPEECVEVAAAFGAAKKVLMRGSRRSWNEELAHRGEEMRLLAEQFADAMPGLHRPGGDHRC